MSDLWVQRDRMIDLWVQRDTLRFDPYIKLRGGRAMRGDILQNRRTLETVAVESGGSVIRATRGIGSQEPVIMLEGDELDLIGHLA